MFDWSAILATSGQLVMYRAVGVAVVVTVLGFSLALVARLLGDKGPQYDGRLSLNPLDHAQPVGALLPLFFRMGWIRPIEVNPALLKGGKWGLIALVLGGLALLLVFSIALWALRPLIISTFTGTATFSLTTIGLIETIVDVAFWFAVLNIIPIPPLVGGMLLIGFAPSLYRAIVDRLAIASIVLGVIVLTAIPNAVLAPAVDFLKDLLLT